MTRKETPSEYLARVQREQDRRFASTGIPTSNQGAGFSK